MSLSPGQEIYHKVNYQSIAGAFICFNHLTDQVFIWDWRLIQQMYIFCNLLRRRKRFRQPALAANSSSLLSHMVAYICVAIALIILRDTLSSHACLLITQPRTFISSSSLAFFLPPPGSLALSLSSSERGWISHSLGVDRETSSSCFSRVFLCIFYDGELDFQVVLFIYFFAAREPWWSSMWYWLTESKYNRWKGE